MNLDGEIHSDLFENFNANISDPVVDAQHINMCTTNRTLLESEAVCIPPGTSIIVMFLSCPRLDPRFFHLID